MAKWPMHCDVCGRIWPTKTVILKKDESGEGEYCAKCIKNNPHVKFKEEKL
jgi:hypothetical protein